eukprot:3231139-Rhodomonas_salina.1
MQDQTRKYADRLQRADEFYMQSVGLCATAAFGVTLSAVALKGMTKADEWSTGLFKMFGKKGEGFVAPGFLPSQPYTPTPTQMMSMLPPPPAMT